MPKPYYTAEGVTLHLGNSLDVLSTLPDASVDAVVTDPPYELGFMGKAWDASGIAYNVGLWRECWRVLKPGGHLLAFGGTRTYHRMTVAIEDAGFEIRDSLHWIYGSGFPKSLDVSKTIDKAAEAAPLWDAIRSHIRCWRDRKGLTNTQLNAALGLKTNGSGMARHWTSEVGNGHEIPSKEMWQRLKDVLGWPDCDLDLVYAAVKDGPERPVVGLRTRKATGRMAQGEGGYAFGEEFADTVPATEKAAYWRGWGTALKPAHEPIVLARKPLASTVAANVLEHGTGALNIDDCRTEAGQDYRDKCASVVGLASNVNGDAYGEWTAPREDSAHASGRWPTNILLGHGPDCVDDGDCQPGCPVAEMDQQSGVTRSSGGSGSLSGRPGQSVYGSFDQSAGANAGGLGDSGGASRFFPVFRYEAKAPASERPRLADGTAHTTVKPLALMRWLVRLVTPPGGTVLEPFAGSGTTLEACVIEGMQVIGVELDEPHAELCKVRLSKPIEPTLFGDVA
ncbi:DNA methyltransferase [Streptomyces sp. NBC_00847]|uniref:DNA methyltransferase n=1 Tax=Streptomyces sp. NBC_00847 TaxID=2975850 RepID=UPI00225E10A1|nr:DNA methyltransferase [Streptomyces sp. NBC_00847]MCX4885904.1 site-specific DNA-methyltransferase [Streptomyces sp. NBC_00847]